MLSSLLKIIGPSQFMALVIKLDQNRKVARKVQTALNHTRYRLFDRKVWSLNTKHPCNCHGKEVEQINIKMKQYQLLGCAVAYS